MVLRTKVTYPPRSAVACKNPTGPKARPDRAVLSFPDGIETGRIAPSESLAPFIEHYWWVRWDVKVPRTSEVLPYPSIHLVFEGVDARIFGIVRKKFIRKLEGRGEVFGIKFRPGMFRSLSGLPCSFRTDRELPLKSESWGEAFASGMKLCKSMPARLEMCENALPAIVGAPAPKAVLVRDLVERMRAQPDLRSVANVSAISGLSERTLQRLFQEFTGVSPKWVLRRFRLQEAADRLVAAPTTVAAVAADLGYFDQAHFVRDFKAVIGQSPISFLRQRSLNN